MSLALSPGPSRRALFEDGDHIQSPQHWSSVKVRVWAGGTAVLREGFLGSRSQVEEMPLVGAVPSPEAIPSHFLIPVRVTSTSDFSGFGMSPGQDGDQSARTFEWNCVPTISLETHSLGSWGQGCQALGSAGRGQSR